MQFVNPTTLENLSILISSYRETHTLARMKRNTLLAVSEYQKLNSETDQLNRQQMLHTLSVLIRDIFSDIHYSFDRKEITLSQYIDMLQTLNS